MARKYLKNRERIILHLSRFRGNVDSFNAPYFITQDGIAEAIGVGRNNVSRELNKLVKEGLVVMKKARVPNSRNRKNVYILTSSGVMKAKEIRGNIRDLYINLINFSGESENITVKEAQRMYNLDLITIAINLNRDLVLDLKAMMRKDDKKVHYIEENFAIKSFYGRSKELETLKNWVSSDKRIMIVNGISGIGKTTLLLKFVNEYLKDRDVFFIRIEEYKNAIDILYQFAEFFSMVGNPKLERYLRTHGRSLEFEINITNALMIIKKICSGEIIIFDNVEDANSSAKILIQKLIDILDGENCKIILAGVGADKFIKPSMLGKISDIYLSELSDEDAYQMLRDEGVSDDLAFKIISKYGGIPIVLEIAKSGDVRSIRKYLFEGILNNLSPEERRAVEFSSVFRKRFKMNALLLNNVEYSVIYSLINRNILKEMEYEKFSLHRILRNFIYERLPSIKRKEYHITAATYFMDEGDVLEAIYHYVKGGKYMKANMLLVENYHSYLFNHSGEIRQLALDILNSYEDLGDEREATLYGIIGDTYKLSGDWKKALENYEKMWKLSFNKDLDSMALASWKIAEIYGKQGNAEKGLNILKEALKHESKIENLAILARIYYVLGNLQVHYGNYEEAHLSFIRSLEIGEKAYELEVVGYSYLGLGRFFKSIGDYESALKNFIKARDIFKESTEEQLGYFYAIQNIGSTYYEKFDSKAEEYLKESIRIAKNLGDEWSLVTAYHNYANWLIYTDKYNLAKEYLLKAERTAEMMDAKERLFYIYLSWGSYYSDIEKIEDAQKYFDRAIELAAEMGADNLVVLGAKYAIDTLKESSESEKYEKIARGKVKVVSLVRA